MEKETEFTRFDTQKTENEIQSLVSPSSVSNSPTKKNTQKKSQTKKAEVIPFFKLFRFAKVKDWLLIIFATVASIVNGSATPLFALIFGDMTTDYGQANMDAVVDAAGSMALKLLGLAVLSFVGSYVSFACWMIVGERQTIEIRKQYFKSLLSQEITFFDSINPNELSSKIAEECFNIQSGIGEKVSTFIYSISTVVAGFLVAYIKGWQLALILTAFMPLVSISGALYVYAIQKQTKMTAEAYSKAGAISEEVLNAIRTVVSLGAQEKETNRYKIALDQNKRTVMRFVIFAASMMGAMFLTLRGLYALGFYVGSIFIKEEFTNPVTGAVYTGGDIITVFFSICLTGTASTQIAPAMKNFAVAKTAGAKAFKTIDRKSKISIADKSGLKPSHIEGDIELKGVTFAYPLKRERTILDNISFKIRKNEKTALVGESGCGKTTCMQLIERFYDINEGSIKLDHYEINELNLRWLRENIGYVGQEPVLFATTIKENILMAKENATDDEIWEALKKANAYNFVNNLPNKLNTFVGTNGAQLSGGQKQRLAIARAILKNPKILLLDEATSALDRKNELEIQKTLDEISEGRTTIVIAHRLTTIQNADHIIVFDQGQVVEEGKHDDLIGRKGKYYALQHLQIQADEKNEANTQEDSSLQKNTLTEDHKAIRKESNVNTKNSRKSSKKYEDNNTDPVKFEVEVKVEENRGDAISQTKKKKIKEPEPEIYGRLFRYNKQDIPILVLGLIFSLINGIVLPFLSLFVSEMLDVYSKPSRANFTERANLVSLLLLILAILSFLGNAFQLSLLTIVGENLSRKVRVEMFRKYQKMPMEWFDKPENSPGALSGRLAQDAALINTLTSSVIGVFLQAISSFVCGMAIAFVSSWQLTLVGLGLSPLMVITGKMEAQLSQGFSASNDGPYQESIGFVSEAVNNMKTVASFGREEKLLENYSKKLDIPLQRAVKKGNLVGFAYGLSQLCYFLIYAVVFYLGAIFMRDIELGYLEMFQSVLGITFAAYGVGTAFQFSPDLGAAKNAAINVFKILDEKPTIDIDDPKQTVKTPIKGNIEFRNVSFRYPSRDKQIFKNLSFKINASTKVALVGPSGCGKSTILALIQRFYDADSGEILIDGVNTKDYDLRHLRESYGVVSQEPVLFNGTIEYNIKYAKDTATDAEMRQAAEKASALGFIEKNEFDVVMGNKEANTKYETGFQRKVGPKGSQLSGGQKQRIAIARVILKNPSVMILDEATSALDTQNEKVVQESLDKIMQGKTSVIVAHRISTIKDADEILVFNEGEIVERGNYSQLIQMQGMFYKLERGIDLQMK